VTTAWELLSSERQGPVGPRRVLTAKTFRMPDGSEKTFTVTEHSVGAAAAVVALTVRGTVVLAEQYRPGPERVMAELPGGGINPGEPPADGAVRELAEETGYAAEAMTYLGEMRYDAYDGMVRHYFLGTGCERRHEQRLDPGEFVTVREVTPSELLTLAMAGEMTDPGGVLLALPYLTDDPQVRALLANPAHESRLPPGALRSSAWQLGSCRSR
jgi:ADP-ribose pyrophosphatase